jgi:chromosome segregation ATPase
MNLQTTLAKLMPGDKSEEAFDPAIKRARLKRQLEETSAMGRGLGDSVRALSADIERCEINLRTARNDKDSAAIRLADAELTDKTERRHRLRHKQATLADISSGLRRTLDAINAGLRGATPIPYAGPAIATGLGPNESPYDGLDRTQAERELGYHRPVWP